MIFDAGAILVQLEQPYWLLLCAFAVLPLFWSQRGARRGKRLAGPMVALQCLAIALAGLALAQPCMQLSVKSQKPYLLLMDVSDSVKAQHDKSMAWPQHLPQQTYVFAAQVAEENAARSLQRGRTDFKAALQLAAAKADGMAGIVIRTDGRFETNAWQDAARSLARHKLPLWIVPMDSPVADARVSQLSANAAGEGKIRLRVQVASNATMQRKLTVTRNDLQTPLLEKWLDLQPGDSPSWELDDSLSPGEAAAYRAELYQPDMLPQNDLIEQFIAPVIQHVAVIAAGDSDRPSIIGESLSILPNGAPTSADGYAGVASLVLTDAAVALLDDPRRQAIADYVRGGGGLVLLGSGPRGSPADENDPINQVAALVPNPAQRRPLKLIAILDASGSMAETTASGPAAGQIKFTLAANAMLSLQRHLTSHDGLVVITFSDQPVTIYDSGFGAIDFSALRRALDKVMPSGPTSVLPAIERALAVENAVASDKLVMLLSDLRTEQFDARSLAERFRKTNVKLAIAATLDGGTDNPLPLESLARQLDAPLMATEQMQDLAWVFDQLLRKSRLSPMRSGKAMFKPQGPLFDLSQANWPSLDAYILCRPHEEAQVLALAGPADGAADPVLARRTSGLGRAVSLAMPFGAGQNQAWQASPQFKQLLKSALEWSAAAEADSRFWAKVTGQSSCRTLELTASGDQGPMNLLKLSLLALDQDSAKPIRMPLLQFAPGKYRASLPSTNHALALAIEDHEGKCVWRGLAPKESQAEYLALGADMNALRQLAALAGGKIVAAEALPQETTSSWRKQLLPLWPVLLAASLAAMLLEWCLAKIRRSN